MEFSPRLRFLARDLSLIWLLSKISRSTDEESSMSFNIFVWFESTVATFYCLYIYYQIRDRFGLNRFRLAYQIRFWKCHQ